MKAPLSVSSPAALRYGHETIGEDSFHVYLHHLLVSNAPATAKLAGAFFFLPALVDLAPVRHIDHENDKPAVVDIAQNPIITDPVSPHASQVPC